MAAKTHSEVGQQVVTDHMLLEKRMVQENAKYSQFLLILW